MLLKPRTAFPILLSIVLIIHLAQSLSSFSMTAASNENNNEYSIVGLVQSEKQEANQLTEEDIEVLVGEAIKNSGGLIDIIKPDAKVIIKVNLVDTMNDTLEQEVNGITVDWRVTKAVINQVLGAGAKDVFVVENSLRPTNQVFHYMGYDQIKEIPAENLIALEEDIKTNGKFDFDKLERIEIKEGLIKRVYYVNKRLLDADAIISIAVLKTHRRIALTGTVKSIGIGCYPPLKPNPILSEGHFPNDRGGFIDHRPLPLSQWITDYYSLIPAQFALVDGLQGAQNGPLPLDLEDRQMNMRAIVAGKDPIAVDSVASLIMGIKPESALYLKMLEERGLGITDPSKILVVGDKVSSVRKQFKTLYGKQIPQSRNLEITITEEIVIAEGLEVEFNIRNSDEIARIELLADDKVLEYYDKKTRVITINKEALKSKLTLRVYTIYLDECDAEVGRLNG
ncbi:MAG: hypothetical protein JM58_00745 [Peptococcaceae bacterium BICA1-8]|nr:MAG: hypothetical protein JM58_00745 [Peptococcaceae bacterium BICA1-8]